MTRNVSYKSKHVVNPTPHKVQSLAPCELVVKKIIDGHQISEPRHSTWLQVIGGQTKCYDVNDKCSYFFGNQKV